MFVYLVNILAVCVFALLFCRKGASRTEREEKLNRFFFIILCFVQCWVVSSMRYNIGTDYYMYAKGFVKMAETGFSDLKYEDWEIGYILLNKFIGLFTKKASVMFSIAAALSLVGPMYMTWRHSKNPFMSVFIFLNTYLFYLTLNYVRQGIAMSIMCFAFDSMKRFIEGEHKHLWKNKDMWLFILLIGVAATFHLPVIYLIPVLFVSLIKLNLKTLPIYAVGLIVYFAASDAVLKVVLSHFHKEYADSRFIKYGISYVYAIFMLVICVAMIALAFWMRFRLTKYQNMLLHLILMMGFWQIVMTKHALFERFSYYTMPFLLIAIPEFISMFKEKLLELKISKANKKLNEINPNAQRKNAVVNAETRAHRKVGKIVLGVNVFVFALMLTYNMVGLIIPKNGAHGVLPYRTLYGFDIPNIDGWFKS